MECISCYFVNPKDGTEMVLVLGGWFQMGSGDDDSDAFGDEKPRHLHYVNPFYIAITCVTVAQFAQFVEETGYKGGEYPGTGSWGYWKKDPKDYPVRYINWYDAKVYADWAGLRLPTEAEWELSARGYSALKYPWGDSWEDGKRVCWDEQKGSKGKTAPVFYHPEGASPFGTFQ
jgi:serine/threonine-protein kinase